MTSLDFISGLYLQHGLNTDYVMLYYDVISSLDFQLIYLNRLASKTSEHTSLISIAFRTSVPYIG